MFVKQLVRKPGVCFYTVPAPPLGGNTRKGYAIPRARHRFCASSPMCGDTPTRNCYNAAIPGVLALARIARLPGSGQWKTRPGAAPGTRRLVIGIPTPRPRKAQSVTPG